MRRERARLPTPLAFSIAPTCPTPTHAATFVSSFRCPIHPRSITTTSPCMVAADSDTRPRLQLLTPSNATDSTNSQPTTTTYYGAVSKTPTATRDDSPNPGTPSALEGQENSNTPNPPQTADEDAPLDFRLVIAGAGFLLALTAGGFAAASGVLSPEKLLALSQWFETLGPSAVFLYSGLYFLLELIGVPALPLTMGSGYLFGVLKGTVAVSVASTAAAAAAFVIARYGLRNSVSKLASRYPRFRAMDRAIGREGFKFVFLLRLSPLLPFSISNYLYGLTSVDLPAYVAGSWLGMLPGSIAYVSAGAAVSALTDLNNGKGSVNPGLVVLGLVATVAALWTVGKMATEAIKAGDEEEVVQG